VFTKYDILITEAFIEANRPGVPESELEHDAKISFNNRIEAFRGSSLRAPCVEVSTERKYKRLSRFFQESSAINLMIYAGHMETLNNLTDVTQTLLHDVKRDLWAAVQQISAREKVKLCIRYVSWRRFGPNRCSTSSVNY
jgi:hypothetical protein